MEKTEQQMKKSSKRQKQRMQIILFVHLPDGYDTILNEEASNISQGQKQL